MIDWRHWSVIIFMFKWLCFLFSKVCFFWFMWMHGWEIHFSNSPQSKILQWCFIPPELLPVTWVLKSISVTSSCCSLLTRDLAFKEQRSYRQINFPFQVYLGYFPRIFLGWALGLWVSRQFVNNDKRFSFSRALRLFPVLISDPCLSPLWSGSPYVMFYNMLYSF